MAIDQVATVEVRVNGEEAKQELKNLEAIASGLKKELADAYNAGDTSKIKQVTSELRKTEAQIKTLKKDTTALTEVMNNLDKATPKELRATLTAINRQLNSGHIKRGSAECRVEILPAAGQTGDGRTSEDQDRSSGDRRMAYQVQ